MEKEDVAALRQDIARLSGRFDTFASGFTHGQRWSDAAQQQEKWRSLVRLFGVIALLVSWLLYTSFRDLRRELRILQVHVQDTGAILIREGIAEPGDFIVGPNANAKEE